MIYSLVVLIDFEVVLCKLGTHWDKQLASFRKLLCAIWWVKPFFNCLNSCFVCCTETSISKIIGGLSVHRSSTAPNSVTVCTK